HLLEGLLLLVRLPGEHTTDYEDGSDQGTGYGIGSPSIHFLHLDPPGHLLICESS
ncbi:MAG: hypothetical protein ACI80F_002993, partial [Natronomonas sp.]